MESIGIKAEVLHAMFPNASGATILSILDSNQVDGNMELATAKLAAKSNPKLNLDNLRDIASDPAAAVNEAKQLAEEVTETYGAEIYDVPNATEYIATIVPVPSDTTRWDRSAFYNNEPTSSSFVAVAPGASPGSTKKGAQVLSSTPPKRKHWTQAVGNKAGADEEDDPAPALTRGGGGSFINWSVPSVDTTPARDVSFSVPEAEVRWVKTASSGAPFGNLTADKQKYLVARRWDAGLESNKAQAMAVSKYADVFDPDTMECSLARELHSLYHKPTVMHVEPGGHAEERVQGVTSSSQAEPFGSNSHAHALPEGRSVERNPPGPDETGVRSSTDDSYKAPAESHTTTITTTENNATPLRHSSHAGVAAGQKDSEPNEQFDEDFVVVDQGRVDVDELIPQVLPFIRKFVVGQVVVPRTRGREVKLPLFGTIPFTTEEARITSAEIPDAGAIVNVSCRNCFRVRLRQVQFTLEPCHFTYTRNGETRKGILDVVVKRAHLRLGMDIRISAFGRRTAEVYMAKLRLKKFSLKARMKYSPVVNAALSVLRGTIKQAIEEEMTKSLVGEHNLAGM